VVERRAIEVKASDIVRFTNEINSLDWTPDNLLFLDEKTWIQHQRNISSHSRRVRSKTASQSFMFHQRRWPGRILYDRWNVQQIEVFRLFKTISEIWSCSTVSRSQFYLDYGWSPNTVTKISSITLTTLNTHESEWKYLRT
jgi:hypothetical protein